MAEISHDDLAHTENDLMCNLDIPTSRQNRSLVIQSAMIHLGNSCDQWTEYTSQDASVALFSFIVANTQCWLSIAVDHAEALQAAVLTQPDTLPPFIVLAREYRRYDGGGEVDHHLLWPRPVGGSSMLAKRRAVLTLTVPQDDLHVLKDLGLGKGTVVLV